jgi:transketolase
VLSNERVNELKRFAMEIRLETLKEIKNLGFGHIGGAASIIETLAVLYGEVMSIDPKNPKWADRDYFVCSKGHAGPSIYATLALKGYFPLELLKTLNINGTTLPSHCDRLLTTGIDMTTGSLGQGFSSAIGIALGNKLDKRKNYTYLMIGDGELNEGQVWEAAMFAAHHKIDNMITFVDENKRQLDGYTKDINNPLDIASKFMSFGWDAQYVDGSSITAIYDAVVKAKTVTGRPSVIVLDTIKGQGYKFVEETEANHHMRFSEKDHLAAENEITQLENSLKLLTQGVEVKNEL